MFYMMIILLLKLGIGLMSECEHKNTEYIPEEWEINVSEDLICLDCGKSIIDEIERYN